MSGENKNKFNGFAGADGPCEDRANLREILKESVLLNIDIFSSEFEDEAEEDVTVNDCVKSLIEITKQDPKIDPEDPDFILSIEDKIEETEIHQSKREFNRYMKRFPKKRRKVKIAKTIAKHSELDLFMDAAHTNFKIDRTEQQKNEVSKEIEAFQTKLEKHQSKLGKHKFNRDAFPMNLKIDRPEEKEPRFLRDDFQTNFRTEKIGQIRNGSLRDIVKSNFKNAKLESGKLKFQRDVLKSKQFKDQTEQKAGLAKRIKTTKSKIKASFEINREHIKTKVGEIMKEKSFQFNISEIDSRKVYQRGNLSKKFAMEILENEKNKFKMEIDRKEQTKRVKNESEVLDDGFDETDKMFIKKKNNFKIEV